MKSIIVLIAFLIFAPSVLLAQTPDHKKVVDDKFILVNGLMISATIFDIESTYYALDHCPSGYICREGNPVMRPFVEKGRPAIYLVQGAISSGALAYSYYLKKNKSGAWWIFPPLALATVHTVAGTHNMMLFVKISR